MAKASGSEPLVGDGVLRAAALVTVVSAAACGIGALLLERNPAADTGSSPFWLACLSVVAASGLTIAWLRPRNAIGWLLLLCVLLQAVSLVTAGYAEIQYASGHPGPGSFLAASIAEWAWFPSLALPVAVLPSLYPTGRPETRVRRVFVWAGAVGIAALCVEMALVLGPTDLVEGLHLPYKAPAWLSAVLLVSSAAMILVGVVGGLVGAFVRMLRARRPERQQLLWLLVVLVPYTAAYFVTLPHGGVIYAFFGVAVAVGVLRYRLLDIDVVVRRALFYVPLVALVALAVAVVSTAIARLAPSGPLPLLGAAAVVAVLVGPVSAWLRRTVDRFVLGDRADPLGAVGMVAARSEAPTASGSVASLLAALADAVELPYAAVLDEDGAELAAVGGTDRPIEEIDLRASGEKVGTLVLTPPADEPGRRIVGALVSHLANLVSLQRLAREVEEQRQRVDAATSLERERIRRDLHDGLGPSLSGIGLGLQAADAALVGEEPVARGILRRARDEADAAIREVRRALDALGPADLDRHRLDEAVRHAADRLGFDGARGPMFTCSVDVGRVSPEVADVAYRIVGEALHNVARHAHATQCGVWLTDRDGTFRVTISDNGVGIGPTTNGGVGLASMRRRAQERGGTFTISAASTTGAPGTVVDVALPVEVSA
ncbi:MAG TPA: sensor histidine kinase [Nocardioides sp.]|nr:sensor histidine kinase [Nocardioides sp.]